MTEKRYMLEEIGNMFRVLKDNEPLTTKFENTDKIDVINLVEELNELAEKNQRLQKENKILYDENIQLRNKLLHFIQLKDDVKYLEEKGVF